MKLPEESANPSDFSLVLGGPLYQIFLRSGMLRPPLDLLKRRVTGIILLTWLPLLVISAFEGRAFGGVGIPFLKDLDVQVRFLFALPLLILAEKIIHERLSPAVRLFVEKGIVRPEDRSRFDGFLASTMRLRNSAVIEVLLILFIFLVGHRLRLNQMAGTTETWYATPAESGPALSWAGYCYAWLSLPVFQFILMRWWYRLLLWCRFLWLVSRLDLDVTPTHPDGAGGLGFLATSTYAFAPLLVAQSALVSGGVANRILYEGMQLAAFKMELVAGLLFPMLQVLGPLIVFTPCLLQTKRRGLREFGLLADRYVREFDRKWIRGGAGPDEPLVGSGDIQSLADLGGSFDIVRGMRPFVFGKETLVQLAVTTALPMLPLSLTVIPLEELIKKVLGAIF